MLRILLKLMLALLISAFVFAFGAKELHATTLTYIVGTCKAGTQFATMQAALNKSPSANVIEVGPGTYPEQLTIINAVTLEGIVSGNSSAIRITPPAGGLATNATINGSDPAAVDVFVKNATGAVNLTNLIVDSTNNKVPADVFLVGVLYQHSPGPELDEHLPGRRCARRMPDRLTATSRLHCKELVCISWHQVDRL